MVKSTRIDERVYQKASEKGVQDLILLLTARVEFNLQFTPKSFSLIVIFPVWILWYNVQNES